jgi:pyridoxal phosphate enzyme (YggS family)
MDRDEFVGNRVVVQSRIESACLRANRDPKEVLLLPVTKTHSTEEILQVYELGFRSFGENRVQELLKKWEVLPKDIEWHLIGHLQSNKAKYVAHFISMVHSIDSLDTAKELSKRAGESKRKLDVLIEINISGEEAKHGVQPSEAEALIARILDTAPNLQLRGLMGVASFETELERTRPQFALLRKLRESIRSRFPELQNFDQLSMGMSNDFEIAIEEGATIVRIGSALFGERS